VVKTWTVNKLLELKLEVVTCLANKKGCMNNSVTQELPFKMPKLRQRE